MNIAPTLNQKTKELYSHKIIHNGKEGWYRELSSVDTIGIVATAQVLIALRSTGFDLAELYSSLDTLVSFSREDGGFPFVSNVNNVGVVDATGWVCLALSLCTSTHVNYAEVLDRSLGWILSAQNDDGGWGVVKGSPSRVVSTTVALRAIGSIKVRGLELNTAFYRGLKFILSAQLSSGAWPDQRGRECLGATAYALILLSETDSKASEATRKAVQLVVEKFNSLRFWDECLNREEVSLVEDGRPRRLDFYYPLTHLFIRGIIACGFLDRLPSSTLCEYFNRVSIGKSFVGDLTDHDKGTSYGAHDVIMALHEIQKIQEYIPANGRVFLGFDDISPERYPEIYQVGGNDNAHVDVVFLHGLGGDARQTWLNSETGFFLPSKVSERVGVRSFVIGYSNPAVRFFGKGMSLDDRANNLLHLFENSSILKRRTVFIGHSFGGLLIKKMLLSLKLANNSEKFNNIAGVVFVATPHFGSRLAYLLYLAQFLRGPQAVRNLFYDDKELVVLNRDYCTLVAKNTIAHRSFGENSNLTIVNKKSSNPNVSGCEHILLDASHTEICKPRDSSNMMFKSVCGFIKEVVGA